MDTALIVTLIVLALIDSTSIGTLIIPIWLLLQSGRVQVYRYITYLVAIACFYFTIGIALIFGADQLAEPFSRVLSSNVGLYVQLAFGIGLFVLSFRFDPKRREKRSTTRVDRWRGRAVGRSSSVNGLVGLALLAGVLELAMMLPYLGAIGILMTSELEFPLVVLLISAYVVVMIIPALILLTFRILAHDRIEPWLKRLSEWSASHADSATGWVLAIVGFLVARDAAFRLWWA